MSSEQIATAVEESVSVPPIEEPAMTTVEAVAMLIGIEADKVPKLISENGRFEIECVQVGQKQKMPVLDTPHLLRVGRNLWMATWKGPKDYSATQLTQPGT